jgi:signal transduction histidine kinase
LRISTFQILARATAGMVEASDEVTRDEWLTYVAKIDPQGSWQGFRGMALALASEGRDGRLHIPLRLMAPSNPRNDKIIGFDFMSEPLRAQAAMAARDRGEPVFTAPLTLLNDAGQREISLVLMAPIYRHGLRSSVAERREAFAGLVVTGLGILTVVDQAFSSASQRGMALRITDLEAGMTVFDWSEPSLGQSALHSHNATLQIGGRSWLLQFASTPQFEANTDRVRSRMMAVIGLLATLLLTATLYQQIRMRSRAEARAREMTRELCEHRDHLAEMVQAQTADLRRAKEAAERANQAKSDFLTNMSHELRTPLHAVLAFARLGHQRAGKVELEKLRDYFDSICTSGNQLLALVNDLLDLSRLETGKARLALSAIDLRQRLAAVVDELSALLESKQLTCRITSDIPGVLITGDPQRIDQLLRNLLGNAIKFSPAGKTILIGVASASLPCGRRQEDSGERPAVRLTIADEGIGIPAAELESIFDKFIQSSLTASGAGGTGLGLAICREIVHAHRGMIHARNRDEGGAAFEVLLPLVSQDSP